MKNTKTNVIELLKKLQDEAETNAKAYQALGMQDTHEYHRGKVLAYGTAIMLLTDEDYFNIINS